MTLDRRTFIKQCVALYGSVLLLPACTLNKKENDFRVLGTTQARCLAAICEQIIPTDEYPGAVDAGVLNFIDKQLYQRFPEHKEDFYEGIRATDAYSKDTFGKEFAALDWEQQTRVLLEMEQGKLPESYWDKIPQRQFFETVRRYTMQGYYGPPHHGGNKDYVSFRMMKLEYPFLAGQNRYEK